MKNMKYFIKLFGALALTTGTATSVVACRNTASDAVTLKKEYAKLLGLEEDKVKQSLADDFSKVEIKLDPFNNFKFETLLDDNKAKSDVATDFLTELGFTANDKKEYEKDDVDTIKTLKIVAKPADVIIGDTISKTDTNTDFVITKGTVKFEVQKADKTAVITKGAVQKADNTVVKTYKLETKDKQSLEVPASLHGLLNTSDKLTLNKNTGYAAGLPTSGFKLKFKEKEEQKKYEALLNTLKNPTVKFDLSGTGVNADKNFVLNHKATLEVEFGDVTVIKSLELISVPQVQ